MTISRKQAFDGEIGEISREQMARGTVKVAGKVVRRGVGRPAGSDKEQVTLRVDKDVLERYRAAGRGWQTRMNEALRENAPESA